LNSGSALGANLRAGQAFVVTNLAASIGGLTWIAWVCSFINFFLQLLMGC
jgi:ammonia channel protein AmtB